MNSLVPDLPAPRLQFRWIPDGTQEYDWIAIYELVLPLREGDPRAIGHCGPSRPERVIELGRTGRRTAAKPNDQPIRDGAHAIWDNAALGGHLPIITIDPDGMPWQDVEDPATGQVATVPYRHAPAAIRSSEPLPSSEAGCAQAEGITVGTVGDGGEVDPGRAQPRPGKSDWVPLPAGTLKVDPDIERGFPDGTVDRSTYSDIESALDRSGAPISQNGRYLTLPERVKALADGLREE